MLSNNLSLRRSANCLSRRAPPNQRLKLTERGGRPNVVLQGQPFGTAWDFDRATGRIVVTETVVNATVRIVVMQHWLNAFRKTTAAAP